jgi:mono/diheme cytochrome c family protein
MNFSDRLPVLLVIGVLGAGATLFGSQFLEGTDSQPTAETVRVPDLSATARKGKVAFDAVCAQCHGANGAGSDKGPPLVHPIYNPGHHGDMAFFLAAKNGVRRHHWKFGDMPPQPQVKEEQIAEIVAYIRELQRANGIVYEPHRM